jgi:3,4-dihydroxy 2-butanone 4-phosphate synthase/GTP cyclohydrolase II
MSITDIALSPIEEIIEDARAGRMFILVDAEDRENEGDLVIPADFADAAAINFMARFGRGLICLSMTHERVRTLDLPLMSANNGTRHSTAFTVSIEAREGVTTGISAHDRARTIAVAIDPTKSRHDIVTPGHVFPLMARDGGVLVRAGHTEAAVDIARLAGLSPAGVICEIMKDDGTMARLPDLMVFAAEHGLKVGTIADLIAYRRKHDRIIRRAFERTLQTAYGQFDLKLFINTVEYAEHVALVKGDVSGPEPVLVRMHAVNFFDDLLSEEGPRAGLLPKAMRAIEAAGRGVIVLIRDTRSTVISDLLLRDADPKHREALALRDYGVGAQILLDLGLKDLILLSNTSGRTIVGLDGYGLNIIGRQPIETDA